MASTWQEYLEKALGEQCTGSGKQDGMGKKKKKRKGKEKIEEGDFVRGYWIELHGRGGMIDSEFVKDKKGFKRILMNWANTLSDGDIIKIKSGSTEV